MGSYRHVYVGPYFRCVTPIVSMPVEIQGACPNKDCKNYGKEVYAQFCGKCGTKAATVESTKIGPLLSTNDVRMATEHEDVLTDLTNGGGPIVKSTNVAVHLWIGNAWPKGYKPTRSYSNSRDEDTGEQQLPPEAIEQEKRLLREAFDSAYKVLEKLYRPENVQVCWGIIAYDY